MIKNILVCTTSLSLTRPVALHGAITLTGTFCPQKAEVAATCTSLHARELRAMVKVAVYCYRRA